MVGMLQILTGLLAAYLFVKGIEILFIALSSNRDKRLGLILAALLVLIGCAAVGIGFVALQNQQADSISRISSNMP